MKNRKHWKTNVAATKEVNHDLTNPSRGWYEIHSFLAEEEVNGEAIRSCIAKEDSLVLVRIHLGAYAKEELSQEACEHIREILDVFCDLNKDIILRCTYDFEGKGMEQEPGNFSLVQRHAGQLAQILSSYASHIFLYQGVLLGNWGEMHNSKFLTKSCVENLLEVLWQQGAAPYRCSVRKPVQWRNAVKQTDTMEGLFSKNLTIYDDGILGSDTHLGSFGELPKEKAGWDSAWQSQDEREFLSELTRWQPYGGEVVAGEDSLAWDLEQTVQRMKELGVSYLNRRHHRDMLQYWESLQWHSNDCWDGMNGRDYIGRHLGYRMLLWKIQDTKKLKLHFINKGFAPIYDECRLILWRETEEFLVPTKEIECDIGHCDGQEETVVILEKPQQEGRYLISLQRIKDGRTIYLANASCEDGRVFIGSVE